MIYFIITCSLVEKDYEIRKQQYINGISALLKIVKIPCKIIIVENNGKRETFLDKFGLDILYTNNNAIPTNNKGIKELKDVWDCVQNFNIQDEDLIVKITGRYILQENSNFISTLNEDMDCIMKYGNCDYTAKHKVSECLTVLVAMKTKYVKKIKIPSENECVEWCWAKASFEIPDDKIRFMEKLGILICPGNNTYFLV